MKAKYDDKYLTLVIKRLSNVYGNPHTQLKQKNMCELFVAVLLSPQCTDKQVNNVTSVLFKKYHNFSDYSNADIKVLTNDLRSLNYYKTKARYLKRACAAIEEKFDGRVPKTVEELTELYGVGRKVANVVLNEGYGINEGIAVDTHCARVAYRLGLSKSKDPSKIEQDLLKKVGEGDRGKVSNLFIEHGRKICHARNRECGKCVLNDFCPSSLTKNKNPSIYIVSKQKQ